MTTEAKAMKNKKAVINKLKTIVEKIYQIGYDVDSVKGAQQDLNRATDSIYAVIKQVENS